MWLLRKLPMFDWICPECEKTLMEGVIMCQYCSAEFEQATKIPPGYMKNVALKTALGILGQHPEYGAKLSKRQLAEMIKSPREFEEFIYGKFPVSSRKV